MCSADVAHCLFWMSVCLHVSAKVPRVRGCIFKEDLRSAEVNFERISALCECNSVCLCVCVDLWSVEEPA